MMQISPQSQFKTCSIIHEKQICPVLTYFGFDQIHKIFATTKNTISIQQVEIAFEKCHWRRLLKFE